MRERADIEADSYRIGGPSVERLTLETLLDIRDLLSQGQQAASYLIKKQDEDVDNYMTLFRDALSTVKDMDKE